MSHLVSRNPFAREELHRTLVPVSATCIGKPQTCYWCGSPRFWRGKPSSKLYRYHVERDGISLRPETMNGLFCCASCFRAYHDLPD